MDTEDVLNIADKPDDQSAKLREKAILEEAEKSIEENRKEEIVLTDLEPDIEYSIELAEHEFPFGTAVDIERVVLQQFIAENNQILFARFPDQKEQVEAFLNGNANNFPVEYQKAYIGKVKSFFNGVVCDSTFKWRTMDTYGGYTVTDKVVRSFRDEAFLQNFRGHCIFWNRRSELPDNLRDASKDEIKAAIKVRALDMIKRYPEIKEWDLLNEPLKRQPRLKEGVNKDEVVLDPQEDMDFLVELFKEVKQANPEARLYVNEYSILSGNKTDEYVSFIQQMVAKGAPIDGIGIQGHIRDWDFATVEQAKVALDKLSRLGIPIKITEFDVTDDTIRKKLFPNGDATDENVRKARAEYFRNMLTLFFGTSSVNGVFIWGFQDKCHWRGNESAGLFDAQFNLNDAGNSYNQRVHKDWKTSVKVKSDNDGKVTFRGFKGKYKATKTI